jgi:tetratricopeptide (TPR) repeat protein
MKTFTTEIKIKLKKFYQEKNYSKLEKLLEKQKSFNELPVDILMIYAVSKALNPRSKINDYKKAAYYFEKIYSANEKNLEPLYNLIIVSLKANMHLNLNKCLENAYKHNDNDPKILEGLSKTNFFLGNMDKATLYYEKLSNLTPNSTTNRTKFLASINYHQNIKQETYLDYCKDFDETPKPSSSVINRIKKKKKNHQFRFFFSRF